MYAELGEWPGLGAELRAELRRSCKKSQRKEVWSIRVWSNTNALSRD
jgi:hypothetical protein